MPDSKWLHALTLRILTVPPCGGVIPILQMGKWRHGKVKHLTQGLRLVSGKAEIQTLAMRLWLPGVLTTVQPWPSMAFMQLINTGKFKCTCSVYIPSTAK